VSSFESADEFRDVIDRVFAMMSTDPDMGPKLRDANTPQRFEFPDVDMVVNIGSAAEGADGGHCLVWEWSDDCDWEPEVRMTMDSEVANRYFQGKENIPMAIARRRIKTAGNIKKALALLPVTKPVFARYRAMLEANYPHLLA
jgi:SCP-2 sterol transfer family